MFEIIGHANIHKASAYAYIYNAFSFWKYNFSESRID